MAQQYALTLDLLLQVLQRHHQTYHIGALVPAEMVSALKQKATRGTLCRVSLVIEGGQIASCLIVDQQERVLLEGAQAFASVRSCEQIVWSVQPVHASGALRGQSVPNPLSPMQAPSLQIPWALRSPARLTLHLSSITLAPLSRKQRLVLVLIDGKRTVADLSKLLSVPTGHIEEVLNELEALGLIT